MATRSSMKVPLLDLKAQYAAIRDEVDGAVASVFESQVFVLGPIVERFEQSIAGYSGCTYGVGVSSGTDALLMSLMAEGIGRGDEVITTPYTFFATVGCIVRVGARPVLVDIDAGSFNLDVDRLESAITEKTRAVIPVHLFGRMAEMDRIMGICDRRGLVVIEDAAQSLGAELRGRRAGSFGHFGCFSFYPSKNLAGAGDGGMVVTPSEERVRRLRSLRNHGMEPRYYHSIVGGNFRLDAVQAAVLQVKLAHLDAWTSARRRNARRYDALFTDAGLDAPQIVLPSHGAADTRHVFNQYVIRADRRDELMASLHERDIGCEVYYPVPLHLQECFADLGYTAGDFPESERAAAESLALPIYPELSDDAAAYVVDTIAAFYR